MINSCVQCKLSRESFYISVGSSMVGTSRGRGREGREKKKSFQIKKRDGYLRRP